MSDHSEVNLSPRGVASSVSVPSISEDYLGVLLVLDVRTIFSAHGSLIRLQLGLGRGTV